MSVVELRAAPFYVREEALTALAAENHAESEQATLERAHARLLARNRGH